MLPSAKKILFLIDNKDAKNTIQATERCWRVFQAYCLDKGISMEVENITKAKKKIWGANMGQNWPESWT